MLGGRNGFLPVTNLAPVNPDWF